MLGTNTMYEYLSSEDTNINMDLWQQLPENPMKDFMKPLITTGNPLSKLFGFGSLLPAYCHGSNCFIGEILGNALYRYGKELFISGKYPDLFLMTVIGYAYNYLTALINLGKFVKADNFIETELPFWQEYENDPDKLNAKDRPSFLDNFKSILVSRIDILMQLNRIDEAWEIAFNRPGIEGNPASDIELQRLREKLKALKSDVGQLDKDEKQRRAESNYNQQENANTIMDSLKEMVEQSGMDPVSIDKMKQAGNLDPYTKDGFDQTEKILTEGETFLQRDSGEINEISVRQEIRRASGIFVDNQPLKDEIINSLNLLKKSLQSALELNNATLINDAYYGLYLCYSRLNESSLAADQLISLRKNLESIRKGIKNPLERGGVFQQYPYLFYSSVEHLFKSQRFDDMIDAIEGSKGRAITDTLEMESVRDAGEYDLYGIRARLQPLLAKENAHYLTFHVDDDCSYISIIVKTGEIYAAQIPIGKNWLDKYYRKNLHNPASWSLQFKKIDIINELSPFLLLFEKLVAQGAIKEGDHICYSADHLLYLFPLHFLKIKNKSLIELFTVSRVHNAGHLIYLLSKPAKRIETCLTVEVPSIDNVKTSGLKKAFSFCSSILSKKYLGNCFGLRNVEASLSNVISALKSNQLIHFSTHGFFPFEDNPFGNSGLLLSYNDILPTLHKHNPNYKYKDEGLHLLSPKRLLTNDFDLTHSHVSLQACVAGYAREGIGGDALGVEWAFFQKGASSLISTFWNVDINNANEFYGKFYDLWLDKKTSKAVAHQQAILNLKQAKHNSNLPEEFFWAGYGLIGDWR